MFIFNVRALSNLWPLGALESLFVNGSFDIVVIALLLDNPFNSVCIDFSKNKTSIIADINVSLFDGR